MNLMNPKVVLNKDGAKPQGQVVSNMNFLLFFFSSSLSLLPPFVYCFIFRGEKETSTDVSSQWRQSWCGGEEVNVEVSRREECNSQRVFKGRCWTHTHNRCRRRDKKKKASKVVCLENPHHLPYENSRTDLGRQG
jgi:hypothetical protein